MILPPLNCSLDLISEYCYQKLDVLNGHNKKFFSRRRKVNVKILIAQMLCQKGMTQTAEIQNFMKETGFNIDISEVGFYKARLKVDPKAIKEMGYEFINRSYNTTKNLKKYKGMYLLGIDGTCLTLPSNYIGETFFPTILKGRKDQTNMPYQMKLSCVFDLLNHTILRYETGDYGHSEVAHAETLINDLPECVKQNSLIIFDRGYISYRLLYLLDTLGIKYIFRMRKCMFRKEQKELKPNSENSISYIPSKQQTNGLRNRKELREKVRQHEFNFRLCKVQNEGNEIILLTNLEKRKFSLKEINNLYHMRRDAETGFRDLKHSLKVQEFSGRKERLIFQDLYASIWFYNILNLIITYKETRKNSKYKLKINRKKGLAVLKNNFLKAIFIDDENERKLIFEQIDKEVGKYFSPIRENRKATRMRKTKNKSKMSYRYDY